MYLLNYLWTP